LVRYRYVVSVSFLPRVAQHGYAIAVLTVRPPSVRLSVMLKHGSYIGWVRAYLSKVVIGIIRLGSSLLVAPSSAIWSKGNIYKFRVEKAWDGCFSR